MRRCRLCSCCGVGTCKRWLSVGRLFAPAGDGVPCPPVEGCARGLPLIRFGVGAGRGPGVELCFHSKQQPRIPGRASGSTFGHGSRAAPLGGGPGDSVGQGSRAALSGKTLGRHRGAVPRQRLWASATGSTVGQGHQTAHLDKSPGLLLGFCAKFTCSGEFFLLEVLECGATCGDVCHLVRYALCGAHRELECACGGSARFVMFVSGGVHRMCACFIVSTGSAGCGDLEMCAGRRVEFGVRQAPVVRGSPRGCALVAGLAPLLFLCADGRM